MRYSGADCPQSPEKQNTTTSRFPATAATCRRWRRALWASRRAPWASRASRTPQRGLPTRCRRPHRYSGDHERTSIACLHLCLHQEAMYTHFHAECSTLQFLCVSGLHRVQHAHFLTLDVNACEYMYNNPNYCIMEKYSCTYTNAITNAYTCTW